MDSVPNVMYSDSCVINYGSDVMDTAFYVIDSIPKVKDTVLNVIVYDHYVEGTVLYFMNSDSNVRATVSDVIFSVSKFMNIVSCLVKFGI